MSLYILHDPNPQQSEVLLIHWLHISKSLANRGLPGLESVAGSNDDTSNQPTITIHCAQLSSQTLGLSPQTFSILQHQVTHIIHAAWSVNFRMRLRSFVKDHIAGLHHLINFASGTRRQPKLSFISSTASTAHAKPPAVGKGLQETISTDPNDASPLGYSRSKWVAEAIIARAHHSCPSLRSKLSIFRVGQLAGDSKHGVWNASEAWPLMLASSKDTGVLPDLGNGEKLAWLGVDVAAQGILEAAMSEAGHGDDAEGPAVYHILNDAQPAATWDNLVGWVKNIKPATEIVSKAAWLQRLEKLQEQKPEHPALKLLGLWQTAYGDHASEGGAQGRDEAGSNDDVVRFDTSRARLAAPSLRDVKPVDEKYFGLLWIWIMQNV